MPELENCCRSWICASKMMKKRAEQVPIAPDVLKPKMSAFSRSAVAVINSENSSSATIRQGTRWMMNAL